MRTYEAQGKSIDEAIFNGLREMGVSIDEVEIDIVQQETKGILGIGAKPAIVRLIEREPEQIVLPDYLTDSDRTRSGERSGDRRGRNDRRNNRNEGGKNRRNDEHRQPRENREESPKAESAEREDEFVSAEPVEEKPQIEYSAEAAENNEAATFLKGLLKQMDIEGEVLANVSEEGIKLKINSESMGVLIGHRGETLDAIQYLTSLHINRARKENGYTRVTIDVEGYRDKREETLIRLAKKVASQVKSTGRARTMEPMNPYERRILHSALQNHPYVTTYSEGEEPNRRVVVAPKKKGGGRNNNHRRNNNRPHNNAPAKNHEVQAEATVVEE